MQNFDDDADRLGVRDMSHEVIQRVHEWREKDRQMRARLHEMRRDVELLMDHTNAILSTTPKTQD